MKLSQWGMLAMPMGMDGFPSRLFKTNAILGLLVIVEIGLSYILTVYQLRGKGSFSQAADLGNIWALNCMGEEEVS